MDDERWFDARRARPYPEDRVQIACSDDRIKYATYGSDNNYYIRDWSTWCSRVARGVKKWRYIDGRKPRADHGAV